MIYYDLLGCMIYLTPKFKSSVEFPAQIASTGVSTGVHTHLLL